MSKYIVSIDQGTTGTRSYVFDSKLKVVASHYQEFTQHFPHPAWVEHDAEEIWRSVQSTLHHALKQARIHTRDIAGIGITNQRETSLLWDAKTGKPLGHALVWQDRRTAARCEQLKKAGWQKEITQRTGLLLDPYFSGTKIEWMLKHRKGAKTLAQKGRLRFGTIDTWIMWKLSQGRIHATDHSNASRTLLYNLKTKSWDPKLLKLFSVPAACLPEIKASADHYGETGASSALGAGVPILGVAGDQQAALFGQGCVSPGQMKNTYGTGCFLLLNTGQRRVHSKNKMLSTIVCDAQGQPAYGLEGAVFIAGAAIQWLRDGLKIIASAKDTEALARSIKSTGGVYLVPAFAGLGAPYWDSAARGAIVGLTRGSGRAEIARAALESLAFQTRDVVECMRKDSGLKIRELRVDGGASKNNWLMKFQADQLGAVILRPAMVETTALGAARLAALKAGLKLPRTVARLSRSRPSLQRVAADLAYAGWQRAVRQARTV